MPDWKFMTWQITLQWMIHNIKGHWFEYLKMGLCSWKAEIIELKVQNSTSSNHGTYPSFLPQLIHPYPSSLSCTKIRDSPQKHFPIAPLAHLGERQTEVHFRHCYLEALCSIHRRCILRFGVHPEYSKQFFFSFCGGCLDGIFGGVLRGGGRIDFHLFTLLHVIPKNNRLIFTDWFFSPCVIAFIVNFQNLEVSMLVGMNEWYERGIFRLFQVHLQVYRVITYTS